MPNVTSCRILLGVTLAVLAGMASAQPGGDAPYSSTPSATQTQNPPLDTAAPAARLAETEDMATPDRSSSPRTTAKMSGQSSTQTHGTDQAGSHRHKSAKRAHHTAKHGGRPAQVAARGETDYQRALRQCVREQDQGRRDSCLDSAIEQFQPNG